MAKTPATWAYNTPIKFSAPNRNVDTIFLHCSASDKASHDDISVMRNWHVAGNGWSHVGYHFFINKNGDIQAGCSLEVIPIAQKGFNTGSIAICCHGLLIDKFTAAQMTSVKALCKAITDSYDKKIRIRGHREVSKKSCPVYDYRKVLGLGEDGYYLKNPGAPTTGGGSNPPTPTTGVNKKLTPIQLMEKGEHVTALQKLLTTLGFSCQADGHFGQRTAEAVRKFQRSRQLSADGVVGARSINAMFSKRDVVLKRGNKGTDVTVLQLALTLMGKNMMHDGIFGSGTEKALMAQQKLLNIKVDGVFGPITRKKILGLN